MKIQKCESYSDFRILCRPELSELAVRIISFYLQYFKIHDEM